MKLKPNKSRVLDILKRSESASAQDMGLSLELTIRQVQKSISLLRGDGYNIQKHHLNKKFIKYFLVTNIIKATSNNNQSVISIINNNQPAQKIVRIKDVDKLVKKCYYFIKAHGSCNIEDIKFNLNITRPKAIKLLAMTAIRYPDFKLKVSE